MKGFIIVLFYITMQKELFLLEPHHINPAFSSISLFCKVHFNFSLAFIINLEMCINTYLILNFKVTLSDRKFNFADIFAN